MTRYTKTMAETLLEVKKKQEAIDATDTGGEEEVSMAVRQVGAMKHFLEGIESRVKQTGDMEEWFQNKLTKAHDYLKTLYAYGKGDVQEKLKVSDGLGAWISDFQKSDAPQFDNKTPEEKKKMAIAAYVSAGGKLD